MFIAFSLILIGRQKYDIFMWKTLICLYIIETMKENNWAQYQIIKIVAQNISFCSNKKYEKCLAIYYNIKKI